MVLNFSRRVEILYIYNFLFESWISLHSHHKQPWTQIITWRVYRILSGCGWIGSLFSCLWGDYVGNPTDSSHHPEYCMQLMACLPPRPIVYTQITRRSLIVRLLFLSLFPSSSVRTMTRLAFLIYMPIILDIWRGKIKRKYIFLRLIDTFQVADEVCWIGCRWNPNKLYQNIKYNAKTTKQK